MKTPRFTDAAKYPHGYASSAATDIRRTFARVRAEQKRIAAEQEQKVSQIKQRKK